MRHPLFDLAGKVALVIGAKRGIGETQFARPVLDDADVMARRLALTPLRRVGQPDEIAGVALLLASSAGAFMTGQNLVVDGETTIGDGN